MLHGELTDKIISSFFKVYNTLGYGFLEKVYENALAIELKQEGLNVLQQQNIKVYYENQVVGDYFADIIADQVILDMLYKIFYSQYYKRQQHQLSGLPPALKGARKSECAPTRRNSPSGGIT